MRSYGFNGLSTCAHPCIVHCLTLLFVSHFSGTCHAPGIGLLETRTQGNDTFMRNQMAIVNQAFRPMLCWKAWLLNIGRLRALQAALTNSALLSTIRCELK